MNKLELAKNPNTPAETLSELAKDENIYVRCSAAKNPNTPKKQRDEKRVKNKSI
jgi:3-methyladenine DNA glycosylase AlkC